MQFGGAYQPVATVFSCAVDGDDLRVFGEGIVHLSVAGNNFLPQTAVVDEVLTCQSVHASHQVGQGVTNDKILAMLFERLDGSGCARPESATDNREPFLGGQIGVLLGARQGELFVNDGLCQDEPRIIVAR